MNRKRRVRRRSVKKIRLYQAGGELSYHYKEMMKNAKEARKILRTVKRDHAGDSLAVGNATAALRALDSMGKPLLVLAKAARMMEYS